MGSGRETVAVRNYSELIAWQKAMDLVEVVYKLSRGFPKEELYGLTSQIRKNSLNSVQHRRRSRSQVHDGIPALPLCGLRLTP